MLTMPSTRWPPAPWSDAGQHRKSCYLTRSLSATDNRVKNGSRHVLPLSTPRFERQSRHDHLKLSQFMVFRPIRTSFARRGESIQFQRVAPALPVSGGTLAGRGRPIPFFRDTFDLLWAWSCSVRSKVRDHEQRPHIGLWPLEMKSIRLVPDLAMPRAKNLFFGLGVTKCQ
jgi:hypothetical protein